MNMRTPWLRMKLIIWYLFLSLSIFAQKYNSSPNILVYTAPAKNWFEALPLGNGRLGAMVYGNPVHEEIQLNENTIWAGGPYRNDNRLSRILSVKCGL